MRASRRMAACAVARLSPGAIVDVPHPCGHHLPDAIDYPSPPSRTKRPATKRRATQREAFMARRIGSIRITLLAASIPAATMLAGSPALAADVTSERLINADKEPHNWLMNHRTYDGQRFSPLARIDKGNVKNLKLAYAVPLGGSGGNEFIHATPLAEGGFIYITD